MPLAAARVEDGRGRERSYLGQQAVAEAGEKAALRPAGLLVLGGVVRLLAEAARGGLGRARLEVVRPRWHPRKIREKPQHRHTNPFGSGCALP